MRPRSPLFRKSLRVIEEARCEVTGAYVPSTLLEGGRDLVKRAEGAAVGATTTVTAVFCCRPVFSFPCKLLTKQ